MSNDADDFNLEQFRRYLQLLARRWLHPLLRGKVDPADMVQETLLEAHKGRELFRGRTTAERAAWLRQILAHRLEKEYRDARRLKRDVTRERSLEDALEWSSSAMGDWLADDRPSPSEEAGRQEQALRLAEAV